MNPHTSMEVRSRKSSPSGFVNTSNNNFGNSGKWIPYSHTFYPAVPRTNIMARNDIKLSIFNGNGLEYPEKHWFLCEVLWIVRQVQDEAIKWDQMITTLRSHVLYWYMKLSVVLTRVTHKTLNQIRA